MDKKTPEQIVLENYAECRQINLTFKNWSDDTFIGYMTAMMTNMNNLNIEMTVSEWEKLIRKMVEEDKI